MVVERFEVYQVDLNPTRGSEIQKVRPCLVISPNEVNRCFNTIIVAPMTSKIRTYPTRVNCFFINKNGQIALEQLRCVDKVRLLKRLGMMDQLTSMKVLELIQELFS